MTPETGWIYIPAGYAHSFCTLSDNVSVLYKVNSYYSKDNELGIKWNDTFFNINWNLNGKEPSIVSLKDSQLPNWLEIKKILSYEMSTNNDRYLVTGGYGFIGSSLLGILLKNDQTVCNIDKLTYSSNLNSLRKAQ